MNVANNFNLIYILYFMIVLLYT